MAPDPHIPVPPDHLTERAQKLWADTVDAFSLASHQLELLRRLCEASDRADEARELLAADGLTVVDRYGQVKPHPAVNIERDARLAEARLIRELALEPGEPETPRPPRVGATGTAAKR